MQRQFTLTAAPPRMPPNYAVDRPFLLKIKLDGHIRLPQMHQLRVTACPRLPPQHPGDRVQQGRLACAVRARQASQMNPFETHRIRRSVSQKIADLKLKRQHTRTSLHQMGGQKMNAGERI